MQSVNTDGTTFRVSGDQLGTVGTASFQVECGTEGTSEQFKVQKSPNICSATVLAVSSSQNLLVFSVPGGEGKGTIKLVVSGKESDPYEFSYIAPNVTSITGNIPEITAGKIGTTGDNTLITITGSYFGPYSGPAAHPTNNTMFSMREHRVYVGKYACSFDREDTSWSSNQIVCLTPSGAGSNLDVRVETTGVVGALENHFSYAAPNITSSQQLTGTTSGGQILTITGSNLGPDGVIQVGSKNVTELGISEGHVQNWDHETVKFYVPSDPGTSPGGPIIVWPGGFEGGSPTNVGTFTYADPSVTSVAEQGLPTVGGGQITITGESFGTNTSVLRVIVNDSELVVSSHTHTQITAVIAPGVGKDHPVVIHRHESSNSASCTCPGACCFSYGSPKITEVRAQSPGRLIKIFGDNFDPAQYPVLPRTAVDAELISINCMTASYAYEQYDNGEFAQSPHIECTPPTLPADRVVSSTVVSLDFVKEERTFSCFKDVDGNGMVPCECRDPQGNAGTDTEYQSCQFGISAVVGNQSGEVFQFQFDVPKILEMNPRPLDGPGGPLTITGEKFGTDEEPCPPRPDPSICETVGPSYQPGSVCPCPPPVAVLIGEGKGEQQCTSSSGNPWNKGDADSLFMPYVKCETARHVVGPKRASVVINNLEYAYNASSRKVLVDCPVKFYGKPGEYCTECPVGATCDGGETDPYSSLGWWMEKQPSCQVALNEDGTCPLPTANCAGADPIGGGELVDVPAREECLLFIPCEPVDSCKGGSLCGQCNDPTSLVFQQMANECQYLKGNFSDRTCTATSLCYDTHCCGERYQGTRCADCADGFYRLGGECEPCPDCPWCLVVVFICVFVGALLVGWLLQRKEINVGLMSIGIDYLQVVALFAQTNIEWPGDLLSLFRALSIFNLNLELMAPECSFKFGYETKWFWTESVPLLGFAIFLLFHWAKYFHKRCIKNRRNKLHSHVHTMIGVSLVLMYYGYLYITRNTLDVFNCGPTDPDDGHEYMEVVFVKCYEPGGMHLQLLPWAIFFFLLYSCGFPAVVGFILWKGRESAKEDQLLRANNTGTTRKTNPNCFDFRKRYHKLYYNFKPNFVWWILVIIIRKFLISIAAIIFRKNASFQMAIILMVLFGSFAVQLIYTPYMSPSEYAAVLEMHASEINDSDNSAVFDSSYRKKVRKNVKLGGEQLPTIATTAKAVGTFFFNYNTVESVLLTSAIFICLAGIMFQSGRLDTERYDDQKVALTAWVMFLVITSILYWATVAITEALIAVRPDLCQKKKSAKDVAEQGDGFDMNDSLNPLHNAAGNDDAARAHMGKAKAEAALQRHQAVIEQQSLEILELKKKVQANALQSSSSRRMMKKDKGKAKKTKKAFSPVRSNNMTAEDDEDDFGFADEGGVEMGAVVGEAGETKKRDSIMPSRDKRPSAAVL
jgi:hypothetical protein